MARAPRPGAFDAGGLGQPLAGARLVLGRAQSVGVHPADARLTPWARAAFACNSSARRARPQKRGSMFVQLAMSTLMVLATVAFHGGGLAVFGRLLRLESREEVVLHIPPLSLRTLTFTLALVIGLFALHGIEIWAYAVLYLALHAIGDLETAVYFSTITYGGIGFSDAYIAGGWRLLAGIEGVNGVLLLGWSTAFFVTVVARLGGR
jgi:hypothetical protein